MKNIIFIGMPGSGKTTVSRLVAKSLKMPWYDSDAEIERSSGLGIPEIFAKWGEEHFRELETECIKKLAGQSGVVIALGGGAVLKNEELIKKSGVVIYLTRPPEKILSTLRPGTRPLLEDPANLYALYQSRRALYERTGDFTVDNDGSPEQTLKKVLEAIS